MGTVGSCVQRSQSCLRAAGGRRAAARVGVRAACSGVRVALRRRCGDVRAAWGRRDGCVQLAWEQREGSVREACFGEGQNEGCVHWREAGVEMALGRSWGGVKAALKQRWGGVGAAWEQRQGGVRAACCCLWSAWELRGGYVGTA